MIQLCRRIYNNSKLVNLNNSLGIFFILLLFKRLNIK